MGKKKKKHSFQERKGIYLLLYFLALWLKFILQRLLTPAHTACDTQASPSSPWKRGSPFAVRCSTKPCLLKRGHQRCCGVHHGGYSPLGRSQGRGPGRDKREWEADQLSPATTVLACSGCYNKIPQTGWLRNTRKLFLTRLEAGKSKIQAPTDSVAGENLLQLHMAKGAQDFSEASFLSGMRVTSSPAKGPTCKHRQDSTHESGGEIQRFSPQHLLL